MTIHPTWHLGNESAPYTLRMDSRDRELLDTLQNDLPLVERPFVALGEGLGMPEGEVLERIQGLIRRSGATGGETGDERFQANVKRYLQGASR